MSALFTSMMADQKLCPICLDSLLLPGEAVESFPCTHTFHITCLSRWQNCLDVPVHQHPCPVCKIIPDGLAERGDQVLRDTPFAASDASASASGSGAPALASASDASASASGSGAPALASASDASANANGPGAPALASASDASATQAWDIAFGSNAIIALDQSPIDLDPTQDDPLMEEPTLPMPGDSEPTPPANANSPVESAPDVSVATPPQEQDLVVVVVVGVWW